MRFQEDFTEFGLCSGTTIKGSAHLEKPDSARAGRLLATVTIVSTSVTAAVTRTGVAPGDIGAQVGGGRQAHRLSPGHLALELEVSLCPALYGSVTKPAG